MRAGPPRVQRGSLWRRWAAFFLGAALILVFMFGVVPLAERSPFVQPLAKFIRESGIDAQALFYTEVEETGDAETYMRGVINHAPRRR